MIRNRTLAAVLTATTAALALALPSAAYAGTGDGGGGARYTITTARFVGYDCAFYGTDHYGSEYYNCRGGVRVTTPGAQGWYGGTKCLQRNQGWGWYHDPCGQI